MSAPASLIHGETVFLSTDYTDYTDYKKSNHKITNETAFETTRLHEIDTEKETEKET